MIMATSWPQKIFAIAVVCFVISCVELNTLNKRDGSSLTGLFCFYKVEENGRETLKNQSCNTRTLYESDLSPNYQISTAPTADFTTELTTTPTITEGPQSPNILQFSINDASTPLNVTQCFVFKYNEDVLSDGKIIGKTTVTNFSCDFHGTCKNRPAGLTRKVPFNGQSGDLYCCDTNNCNTRHVIIDSGVQQQLCYRAYSNKDNHTGSLSICKQPDAYCMKTTTYNSSDRKQSEGYQCDDNNLCPKYNLTGDHSLCTKVQVKKDKEELCCCPKNKCYVPPWLKSNHPFVMTTMKHSKFSSEDRDDASKWTYIIGVVIAAIILGLAAGGLVWMVKSRKPDPRQHSTFSYRKISAESTELIDNNTEVPMVSL